MVEFSEGQNIWQGLSKREKERGRGVCERLCFNPRRYMGVFALHRDFVGTMEPASNDCELFSLLRLW